MSRTIRIATFNCENLFCRPRIFEENLKHSLELLGYVCELQRELTKDEFNIDRIKELKKKLKGYAYVNDIRGNHMKVKGAADWLGSVKLSRHRINDIAVENTARVINDINAQIICLVEVENRLLLEQFHNDLLFKEFLNPAGKEGYEYILLVDGNDKRGIDVSIMSRLPILWISSHIHERTLYNGKMVPTFSRDCLEVQVKLPDEQILHLLLNHFKSMGYCPKNDPQSNNRRRGQSERVAELVCNHDLQREYVMVAGDLNADVKSPSLEPLLNKEGLYNVNHELEPSQRGTYRTSNKQLDYLIVSDALRELLENVHVERRGMYSRKWNVHYSTIKGRRTEASDHGAVVADFRVS